MLAPGVCIKPPRRKARKKPKSRVKLEKIAEEEVVADLASICKDAASKTISDITSEVQSVIDSLAETKPEEVPPTIIHEHDAESEQLLVLPTVPSHTFLQVEAETVGIIIPEKVVHEGELELESDDLGSRESNNDNERTAIIVAGDGEAENLATEVEQNAQSEIHEGCANDQLPQAQNAAAWMAYSPPYTSQANLCKKESISQEAIPNYGWECSLTTVEDRLKELAELQKQLTDNLKPSVFIGKDRPFSSLEIGHHWDRRKYNPVLLPDLSKVIYPDLDSFSHKTNSFKTNFETAHSSPYKGMYADLLQNSKLPVDRSKKPKAVAAPKQHASVDNFCFGGHSATPVNAPSENDSRKREQPPSCTDIMVSGHMLKVYMNPVEWNPVENQQLVLFEVDSILYEQFFSNCGSDFGLLEALKSRASTLGDQQLQLLSQVWSNETQPIKFKLGHDKQLTIHSFPISPAELKEHPNVLFQINNVYYEEKFAKCKSADGLQAAVKKRARILIKQQENLRKKANALNAAPMKLGNTSSEAGLGGDWTTNPENSDSDTTTESDDDPGAEASVNPANPAPEANIEHAFPHDKKPSPGTKGGLNSLKNWFKKAFTKNKLVKGNNDGGKSEKVDLSDVTSVETFRDPTNF